MKWNLKKSIWNQNQKQKNAPTVSMNTGAGMDDSEEQVAVWQWAGWRCITVIRACDSAQLLIQGHLSFDTLDISDNVLFNSSDIWL